ncbi:MAG: 50S ribosomal protein L31 [Armatimonadetes bacterium]|nr:50S ribosomal protein L31 [Armatimonadota bacterium]
MKPDIHPKYQPATVRCACGNSFQTVSTKPEIRVEICSACHPFYTGKQKIVDTEGRVEKFLARYGLQAGQMAAAQVRAPAKAATPTRSAAAPARARKR